VPDRVLKLLRQDKYVLSCLAPDESPDQILATWFVGSEIHLDSALEADLIVLPKNPCLLGANIGPFWVFRRTSESYELALSVSAHDLEVLNTKCKGYRNIRIASMTVSTISTVVFQFDGTSYQQWQSKIEPIK
jgi:hypothetical protein